MLVRQATTNVASSQESLSNCCHSGSFGRRTDRRPALVKAANGIVTIDSSFSFNVVPPENEGDVGKGEDTRFVLVKAASGTRATDSASSLAVVLPEDKLEARKCKP